MNIYYPLRLITFNKEEIIIKAAFRFRSNIVMVFDKEGEQIPKYQGQYEEVKESILKDAPPDTIFAHGFTDAGELLKVPREEW